MASGRHSLVSADRVSSDAASNDLDGRQPLSYHRTGMTRRRVELGRLGETLAANVLVTKGYRLIERNYRCPLGELDIVTAKGDILVFVEVRTRRGQQFGTPEESITTKKKEHLIAAAQSYLQDKQLGDVDWRIDVVAVELDAHGTLLRIDVLENAVNSL